MTERQIFERALEITDEAARAGWLDLVCGHDPDLRQRIDLLLAAHQKESQFLEVPAPEQVAPAAGPGSTEPTILFPSKKPAAPGNARKPGVPESDDELPGAPDLSFLKPSSKPGSIGALGHYEILQVLGQGGFGIVFKAFDEKLHRLVAIKAMHPQMAATSPPRKRFLREARAAAGIRHENVIQVYSVEEQPLPYLVMEYIDGQTLQQKLDTAGPLEPAEVLHIARQIASGLAAAHALGLIHRDIKPGNILLEQGVEQKVKITDFGLARTADDASLTRTGVVSGTPMYMSPEQATGVEIDARSDLFSLGSVLYVMSCGRPPFRAPNLMAVLRRVAEDTPRPMHQILSEVPDWLETIVDKLHAKDPVERIQSAKELADLLGKCQSELQTSGQVTSVATRRKGEAPAEPPLRSQPPHPARGAAPDIQPKSFEAVAKQPDSKGLPDVSQRKPSERVSADERPAAARQEPRPSVAPRVPATSKTPSPPRATNPLAWLVGGAAALALAYGLWSFLGPVNNSPSPDIAQNGTSASGTSQLPGTGPAIPETPSTTPNGNPSPTTQPVPGVDADRELAEWVLSQPGPASWVAIEGHSGLIANRDQLPGTPIHILRLQVARPASSDFSDSDLQRIGSASRLQDFLLLSANSGPGERITDRGIEMLSQSAAAATLVRFEFEFPVPAVTDDAIRSLNQLPRLQEFVVQGSFTDAGIAILESPGLQRLNLAGTRVSPAGLRGLSARAPNIRGIAFNTIPLSDADLSPLTQWKLDSLKLDDTQISDGSLEVIGRMTTLRSFDLAGNPRIHDSGVGHLASLEWLESLNLHGTSIGDEACRIFAGLPRLEYLEIHSTPITDAGLEFLAKSPKLKALFVGDCRNLTEGGVRKLQQALPGCKITSDFPDLTPAPGSPAELPPVDYAAERKAAEWIVKFGSCTLVDEQDVVIAVVTREQPTLPDRPFTVAIVNLSGVDDESLTSLEGCRRLRELVLYPTNPNVTVAGLKAIEQNRTLRVLDLRHTSVGQGFANLLPNWPRLEVLKTYGSQIGDDELVHFPLCPRLKHLDLTDIASTQAGIQRIAECCPNLESLTLGPGRMRPTFEPLASLRKLNHLGCWTGNITEAGITVLNRLPDLESVAFGYDGQNEDLAISQLLSLNRPLRALSIVNATTGPGPSEADFGRIRSKPGLRELSFQHSANITDQVLVDLAQIAELTQLHLHHVRVPLGEKGIAPYTAAGIARFREIRPDVRLQVDNEIYPASSAIPYTVIRDLDKTDPLPAWELPAGSPPPVVAPCAPERAGELQREWAGFLKRPVIEELAPLGMKFALIPPGEFRRIFTRPRDPAIEPEMPVRRFRLTKPYALATTEVTWDQFRQFVEATGYQTEAETNGVGGLNREFKFDPKLTWRTPGWTPDPHEPVTQVTPRDAEAFCAWLTKTVGRVSDPSSPDAADKRAIDTKDNADGSETRPTVIYRLPTEAEWQHACRAGSVHKHVFGPDPGDLADYAWTREFLDPNPQANPLKPVGTKKANPFGLHDMLGNVWERATDLIGSLALAAYSPTNDPRGPSITSVLGQSFVEPLVIKHPDYVWAPHTAASFNCGFRVLRQFDDQAAPGPLDRPLVLRPGAHLSLHAVVPRPAPIAGLRSWSVELAMPMTYANAIAVSPRGDLIATGGPQSGKISLWDRDGKYLRPLLGHEHSVTGLEFTPDGRWLVSCGNGLATGPTACVWNSETGALHALFPLPAQESTGLKVAPDSQQFAVGLRGFAATPFCIVNLRTGEIRTPSLTHYGRGVAWSPDGTELATCTDDNRLRVWDVKSLQVVREVEAFSSNTLAWSPDGQKLAVGAADFRFDIRDSKSLTLTNTVTSAPSQGTAQMAWLPDSQRVVCLPNSVFDIRTGERIAEVDIGGAAVALFEQGKEFVFDLGGRLRFHDATTGQVIREGVHRRMVDYLDSTLSSNGKEVYQPRGLDVLVFDAASGAQIRRLSRVFTDVEMNVRSSPDSFWLAAMIPSSPKVLILDAQSGGKRHELLHGKSLLTQVAWSPDAKWLATAASDSLIRVWNVDTGKMEHELAGHTGSIWSLVWSPDGAHLASAADDKTVRLWNPLTGKPAARYEQFPEPMQIGDYHRSLSWSGDSRRLWIALSQHVVSLEIDTGVFSPPENFSTSGSHTVLSVDTSPDGRRLLATNVVGGRFLRGRDAADRRSLGYRPGANWKADWYPDSRRILSREEGYGTVGLDLESNRRLGILFPVLTDEHWLCIGPTGHYRGSPGVESQIVYVAMHDDGSQRTYTPAEFAEKFGWKNDPEKASLLKLVD